MQGLSFQKNYFEANAYGVLLVSTLIQKDGSNGVYWEYISPNTPWVTSTAIADSGLYRTNASKLYVSNTIGTTGATAPTHTSGTVSDGGVEWTYVATYDTWTAGQVISTIGQFRGYDNKIYRSATAGTTGSTGPTHTVGTTTNYGGSIENNFNQPAVSPAPGYRAFIELGETPSSGF
jgi:hypothetical protein